MDENKIVMFPGAFTQLINEAESYASSYQFQDAVETFNEAFRFNAYNQASDKTLFMYVISLNEIKEFERVIEICDFILNREYISERYIEFLEMYVSAGFDLKIYHEVEQKIEQALHDLLIPAEKVAQFERLLALSRSLATKLKQSEAMLDSHMQDDLLDVKSFFKQPPTMQLMMLQQLMESNIRPYAPHLKQIIEYPQTHVFIKSIALILLVEQQVDIEIKVEKFGQTAIINPVQLQLPTKLPQFQKVLAIVTEKMEQDPTILNMIEQLIAKHSIVTYPFEWLHFDEEDVALSYIDFVHTMFGKVQEMDYEIIEFLETLEKLTELQ